jgi:quercetin dioxygenase-like cupin family protein
VLRASRSHHRSASFLTLWSAPFLYDNEGMRISRKGTRALIAIALATVLIGALRMAVGAAADTTTSTTSSSTTSTVGKTTTNGVTREPLGQTTPQNAPGQTLYFQRVTIAPGAKLAQHFHQGTQLARVLSGVLTYNIASGTATVVRASGASQQYTGPTTVKLRPGDSLVETQGLVHHGANNGKRPVVIELAALLQTGAPLATPVGQGTAGTALHVATRLESQDTTLHKVGAQGSIVYGWNHLTGSATVNGSPVQVEFLGSVTYTSGSGPFSGLITFTFADGSTLGVQTQGLATAAPDGSKTTFAGTVVVLGGTGTYAGATGTGVFTGSRTAALGTAVDATFDLTINGTTSSK